MNFRGGDMFTHKYQNTCSEMLAAAAEIENHVIILVDPGEVEDALNAAAFSLKEAAAFLKNADLLINSGMPEGHFLSRLRADLDKVGEEYLDRHDELSFF